MSKKYKYWLIKENFIYETNELAELLEVHQGSIQRLINKENMPVINKKQKPYLIKGRDAKEFLKTRSKKDRIKLEYYEFICMKCKKAVQSVPENIDFEISNKRMGKIAYSAYIRGICPNCSSKLIRFTTDQKIEAIIDFYTQKSNHAKATNKEQELLLICTKDTSLIV